MAKFRSVHAGLIVQDSVPASEGTGVVAMFVNGEFETTDTKVAARLRKNDYVTEVKDAPAPAEPVTPAAS